jgi:hypothetical protein
MSSGLNEASYDVKRDVVNVVLLKPKMQYLQFNIIFCTVFEKRFCRALNKMLQRWVVISFQGCLDIEKGFSYVD